MTRLREYWTVHTHTYLSPPPLPSARPRLSYSNYVRVFDFVIGDLYEVWKSVECVIYMKLHLKFYRIFRVLLHWYVTWSVPVHENVTSLCLLFATVELTEKAARCEIYCVLLPTCKVTIDVQVLRLCFGCFLNLHSNFIFKLFELTLIS
jgi:hypothetical protein